MQRYKEAKKAKRVVQSKHGKHINIARSGERCIPSTPTPRGCVSQVVTPKQILRGTDAITQAQAHEVHKAWQNLDLERLSLR